MGEEKDYLFSKELRDKLEPFDEMSPTQALKSPEFFKTLLEHADIPEEEINNLLKGLSSGVD